MISIPPAPQENDPDPDAYARYMAELDEKVPDLAGSFDRNAPGMHTTDTLDYVVVIRGEIILELDDGRMAHLRQGGCVIQNGTRHRWINPGKIPCLMAAVMVGGQRDDESGSIADL